MRGRKKDTMVGNVQPFLWDHSKDGRKSLQNAISISSEPFLAGVIGNSSYKKHKHIRKPSTVDAYKETKVNPAPCV